MKTAREVARELVDCVVGYGPDAFYDVSVDIEKMNEIVKQTQIDALEWAIERFESLTEGGYYLPRGFHPEVLAKIEELKK